VSLIKVRIKIPRALAWADFLILLGLGVLIYALIGVAQEWSGPYRPRTEISLSFYALLSYSFLSLVRVFAAYFFSLGFTLVYGYLAAKSRIAEAILIPLLDILQSVPVLGFMPGLVLALVNLFPNSNMGLELAAILMIFTGQGWNMVFSFYSSIKGVPSELREVSKLFKLKNHDVLRSVEIPFSINGLLWNSMLSMAGGWFFLMVIESFTLGDKDFRLPGIGSYMAVAYEREDYVAVSLGISMMLLMIVIVDRCLWAPLVVWSERFKMEGGASGYSSLVWDWLTRSKILDYVEKNIKLFRKKYKTRREKIVKIFTLSEKTERNLQKTFSILRWGFALIGILTFFYGMRSSYLFLAATPWQAWLSQRLLGFS
jgi:NitT/TauT family transport system permease protein